MLDAKTSRILTIAALRFEQLPEEQRRMLRRHVAECLPYIGEAFALELLTCLSVWADVTTQGREVRDALEGRDE